MTASPGGGLSVPALLDEAARRAGRADWGQPSFIETLDLLVDSAERTGALNHAGREVLAKVALRHLRNRLHVQAYLDEHPEVAHIDLGAPIVITGLPRTGTTLLHNLLALDPAHRVLRFWEAIRPVPPGALGGPSQAELVRQAESWLERFYQLVPSFQAIHPASAQGPEECDALLQNAFASQHFDDMFDARAYSAWLNHASLVPEYSYYRLQLQVLSGSQTGSTWVLKSPSHLGHLDALLRTCPDAVVVHCHRHPLEAVPSYASLILALRSHYSDAVSATVVGEQALGRGALAMDRALQVRDRGGAGGFVDVGYARLAREPVRVVRELYERMGRTLEAGLEARMARWVDDNRPGRRGVHRYDLAQFGLSAQQVEAAFATYLDRFGPAISA